MSNPGEPNVQRMRNSGGPISCALLQSLSVSLGTSARRRGALLQITAPDFSGID
jgi:hypothetical protein